MEAIRIANENSHTAPFIEFQFYINKSEGAEFWSQSKYQYEREVLMDEWDWNKGADAYEKKICGRKFMIKFEK
jgi:hypothetical protein